MSPLGIINNVKGKHGSYTFTQLHSVIMVCFISFHEKFVHVINPNSSEVKVKIVLGDRALDMEGNFKFSPANENLSHLWVLCFILCSNF